jgi:hypothetical protein
VILLAFTMEGGLVIGQGHDHFSIDRQGYKLKDDAGGSPTGGGGGGTGETRDEMREATQ